MNEKRPDSPAAPNAATPVEPGADGCWRSIGVTGARSCPRLQEYIHCRNCPVYAAAGRALLEQPASPAQLVEWTAGIAQERQERQRGTLSAGVFRIGEEWLALPTTFFFEVVNCMPIRRLPHAKDGIMLGLTVIRGEILLCMSLAALLGIDPGEEEPTRFCVIGGTDGRWVFPVQEVKGILHYRQAELQPVPTALNVGVQVFSHGLLDFNDWQAGLLDEHMLLHALERSIR